MRVLLVEDDPRMADFITRGLEQEGYSVGRSADGEEGLIAATHNVFDAIVMDVMLPRLDGLSVVSKLRSSGIDTPVLILSALGSVDDRVSGLRSGGDDYLVKPFSFAELVARLETIVRRTAGRADVGSSTVVGEVTIDRERQIALVNGVELDLQRREFVLLAYLVKNQGRVVSKTMILDHVWGYSFDPRTNVVEAKISKLRSKLSEHTDKKWIHTARGLGYSFEDRT